MYKGFFILILSLLTFLGCSFQQEKKYVILTFDDANVEEWFAQRNLFNTYNIKATFFIARPHQLTENQIEKLKILVSDGHEIGCHGLNHLKVTEENQYQYFETEIEPALKLLSDYGFNVSSFAYPFGPSTPYLDSVLTGYFSFIRKATYNYNETLISLYPEIYAKKGKSCITDAMGIDGNFNISMDNLEDAILKAKKMNSFLVLYAHIIDNSGDDYSITPQYLEEFFKLLKKHKIDTVTANRIMNK